MYALLLIVLVVGASCEQHYMSWEQFKESHNKHYSAHEELVRKTIFEHNLEKIAKHNRLAWLGKYSYKLAVNKFSDLQFDEFTAKYNGYRHHHTVSGQRFNRTVKALPTDVDWRSKNIVTPVKDQAQCGSCWAFSAISSLESAHALATGKLVSLSEQNLVDCSQAEGNQGCNGGLMDSAFEYIKKSGGIDTEDAYPYTGQDGQCHFDKSKVGATLKSYVDIPSGDENALLEAVATKGPISVAIDATFFMQMYGGGVFDDPMCNTKDLNHGVTVVGYGSENGKNYWIVKNSWGGSWGEKGYIRFVRGKNLCGIATQASYPVV